MFLAPKIFFGEGSPTEILDWDYKIKHTSEHHAKFCSEWLTEIIASKI